ncbi:Cytoplasmic FMR1-interacting protein 2 [Thelohanellus kitauei]|uniref:Cytoplasmic FMR1-interacting protein 2 n=1 Tax=Thelohanellus kitauei TaxID=669202 RepID=A0A0C2NDI6_THEKT|nr:Cytoplasmic FMR1-interacting protein 2 [Thelohanellus kitauei]
MLSQRLRHSIKESLQNCITYFENQDIHAVIHLSSLIEIYKETHVNLSRDFELPSFEVIFKEVNHDLPGFLPLITHKILRFLIDDLAQSYSFSMVSERFVRSPQIYSTNPPSTPKSINSMLIYPLKGIGQLLTHQNSLYSQFVGIEHFIEIVKLVGYSGFVAIVDEIKRYISILLDTSIKNCVLTLRKAMPSVGTFPSITYGVNNLLDLFHKFFEPVLGCEKTRSEVFHNFRILGNYVEIVYMLEKAVYSREAHDLFLSAPLDGVFTVKSEQSSLVQRSSTKFDFIKSYAFDKYPQNSIPQNLKSKLNKANALNQEKMNGSLSVFVYLFDSVKERMNDSFWQDICSPIDASPGGCCDLNHIISAIFYLLSSCPQNTDLSFEYIFGDGVMYGLLFLIVSLGLEDSYEVSDICGHALSATDIDIMNTTAKQFTSTIPKSAIKKSAKLFFEGDVTQANEKIIPYMKHIVVKRRAILKFFTDQLSRHYHPKQKSIVLFHPPTFLPPK